MTLCSKLGTILPVGLMTALLLGGALEAEAAPRIPDTVKVRSLTPWILDVLKMQEGMRSEMNWSSPDAPDFDEVYRLATADTRPTLSGEELTVETQHTVIHYTLEGDDAATEDQVAVTADAVETVWTTEIDGMGYPRPLVDDGRGGNDKYDFYFTNQKMTYGYCSGETAVDDNSRPSYIALATWMGEVEIQVTVAHEFFHSIHMTMDYKEPTWWLEVTATWMEDQVYDNINDYYNYIPQSFANPETPIDDSGNICYANSIYAHSLSERFGVDIIQDIWFATSQSANQEALFYNKKTIESKGASWPTTIHYFRESMLDLDRYGEGDAYADEVGEVDMSGTFNAFPGTAEGTLKHTGAHMVEFLPTGGYGTLNITYPGGADLVASVFVEVSPGDFEEFANDTSVGGGKNFTVPGFGSSYDRAVMVVTQTALEGQTTYSFSFDVSDWTEVDDPNPGDCSIAGSARGNTHSNALAGLALIGMGLIATRRRARR